VSAVGRRLSTRSPGARRRARSEGGIFERLLADPSRTAVMGVLNVTPDSFSDGGLFLSPSAAIRRAREMVREGADVIDVGGESTRPGAEPVPEAEERQRVVPVVRAIASELGVPVSVDTTKASVAEAALEAGAVIVNDVSAGRADPRMLGLVAAAGAGIVLMHRRGTPRTMQIRPWYRDVVAEVLGFLQRRACRARAAGIAPGAIAVDPGIGFGKTLEHNLKLLRATPQIVELGYPVLIGASRKSFLGAILGLPVRERLEGSLAAAVVAVLAGARIVRVHDVAATVRALRVAEAIRGEDRWTSRTV
jgi:dihydropteroate synthase